MAASAPWGGHAPQLLSWATGRVRLSFKTPPSGTKVPTSAFPSGPISQHLYRPLPSAGSWAVHTARSPVSATVSQPLSSARENRRSIPPPPFFHCMQKNTAQKYAPRL